MKRAADSGDEDPLAVVLNEIFEDFLQGCELCDHKLNLGKFYALHGINIFENRFLMNREKFVIGNYRGLLAPNDKRNEMNLDFSKMLQNYLAKNH